MGMLGLGIAGIASNILGGFFGSSAAQKAAQQQEAALRQGRQDVQSNQNNALDFEKGIWSGTQNNLQPFLTGGQQSLGTLETLLGLAGNPDSAGYGSLAKGFQAPTAAQAEQEPGYQFQRDQMLGALQNSAAAKGNLISGNTSEALAKYANDLAGTNYNQAYNRSFNTYQANQNNQFNRLMALTSLGQQTGTALGNFGQEAGNTVANVDLTAGGQLANLAANIGNAQASGTIGSANAWSGALNGATSGLQNLMLLHQLGGGGFGGGGQSGYGVNDTGTGWA